MVSVTSPTPDSTSSIAGTLQLNNASKHDPHDQEKQSETDIGVQHDAVDAFGQCGLLSPRFLQEMLQPIIDPAIAGRDDLPIQLASLPLGNCVSRVDGLSQFAGYIIEFIVIRYG